MNYQEGQKRMRGKRRNSGGFHQSSKLQQQKCLGSVCFLYYYSFPCVKEVKNVKPYKRSIGPYESVAKTSKYRSK